MGKKLSYEEVKNYIESKGCKLISKEYKNCDTKIDIQCKCGKIYQRRFYNFKVGFIQCPDCYRKETSKRVAIPKEEIIKRLKTAGYKLIDSQLKGGDQEITILCDKGHIYTTRLNKFTSGRRCPYCSSSTGEKRIKDFLDNRGIEYQREYTFEDLRGKGGNKLRFDFAIMNNGVLKMLIEYDGKQHFEYTPLFKDNSIIQEHDNMKNIYCEKHNIPLLRINYKDFCHIEDILIENKI